MHFHILPFITIQLTFSNILFLNQFMTFTITELHNGYLHPVFYKSSSVQVSSSLARFSYCIHTISGEPCNSGFLDMKTLLRKNNICVLNFLESIEKLIKDAHLVANIVLYWPDLAFDLPISEPLRRMRFVELDKMRLLDLDRDVVHGVNGRQKHPHYAMIYNMHLCLTTGFT